MTMITPFRRAVAGLGLAAAMNAGLYLDMKDGYETAARVGGDPVAHTRTGAGTKVVLQTGASLLGVPGLAIAYTAVYVAGVVTLPAGIAVDKIEGAKYRAARYEVR